jgi:hypothetical protein
MSRLLGPVVLILLLSLIAFAVGRYLNDPLIGLVATLAVFVPAFPLILPASHGRATAMA